MRMKTDDDVYRARVVFLGPKGFTLPFRLPFITTPSFGKSGDSSARHCWLR